MKRLNKTLILIVGLLVLVIGIRAILPIVGLRTINWALENKMDTYTGSLEDFDLSLFRGAYQLQGLVIKKKNSKLDPIIQIREADLSLAWRELLRGEIYADVVIDKADLILADSRSGEKKQLGNDEKNWQDILKVLIPISIESLKIRNSSIQFSNSDLGKVIPVKLEDIDFKAEDLRTRSGKDSSELSPFSLSARLQQHADLKAEGKADVMAKSIRGDIDFELVNFKPETMNEILLHYVPLDLTKGMVTIYSEAAMAKGDLVGYANVFLKDVDVIAPKQNVVSLKHFGMELGTAFANWFLKNSDNNSVAAHIPFERRNGKFNVDTSEAFWSAVENRRGDVKPGFETKQISLKNLEGKVETPSGG